MITENDLQEAIAECQGVRNPNAGTCIKLAAFYTIRRELYGTPPYSYAPAPTESLESAVHIESDSEFATAVNGRRPGDVWPLVDELVSTIRVVNPRLYASFMRKIE